MQKIIKKLVFFVLIVLLFVPFMAFKNTKADINKNIEENYNKNYIVFKMKDSNKKSDFALTKKQLNELDKEFGKNNIEYQKGFNGYNSIYDTKNKFEITGIIDSPEVEFFENVKMIEGTKPKATNEIAFSDKALKSAELPSDINKLNEIDAIKLPGLKVTGIYKETPETKSLIRDHYPNYGPNIQIDNGYFGYMEPNDYEYLGEDGEELKIEDEVNIWNESSNYDDSRIVYQENTNIGPVVDYEASVKNGANNLINPKTAEDIYGSKRYQAAHIKLKNASEYDKAVDKIMKIVPNAEIPIDKAENINLSKYYIVGLTIILALVLLMMIKIKKPIKMK